MGSNADDKKVIHIPKHQVTTNSQHVEDEVAEAHEHRRAGFRTERETREDIHRTVMTNTKLKLRCRTQLHIVIRRFQVEAATMDLTMQPQLPQRRQTVHHLTHADQRNARERLPRRVVVERRNADA